MEILHHRLFWDDRHSAELMALWIACSTRDACRTGPYTTGQSHASERGAGRESTQWLHHSCLSQ